MTDWKAGQDPVEVALEEASSQKAVRKTALIVAGVTFTLAALAAGFFLSDSTPDRNKPVVAVPSLPPPPPEPSTIMIDEAKGHSLPYRKFGPEEPREPTRSLAELQPRPKEPAKPRRTVRRRIQAVPPESKPRAKKSVPIPKPAFEDKLKNSKTSGSSFIGGGSMGGGGGGQAPAGYEGEENAATAAARNPAAYAANEQAEAMRALKAVLMGTDGAKQQQTIEWNKDEIYEATEAAAATVSQDHSGRSTKRKSSSSSGSVKIGKDGKPLNLPANMQAELERLGKQYKKKFSKQ